MHGSRRKSKRGWIGRIWHWIGKEIRPTEFFTDEKAPIVCATVLRFNPKHNQHQPFSGDTQNIADMISALTRHKKGLLSLLSACQNKDADRIELLKEAQETEAGYFSFNVRSIIMHFLETHTNATHNYLKKLNQHVNTSAISPGITTQESQIQRSENTTFPDEKFFPTFERVKKKVLESNPDVGSKFWNWLDKNWFDKYLHLLDEKSQVVSMATLHCPIPPSVSYRKLEIKP